jgi:hypothetical protein
MVPPFHLRVHPVSSLAKILTTKTELSCKGHMAATWSSDHSSVYRHLQLHVAVVVGPHQLVVQLLDVHFLAVVLLKKLAVPLLDVLDEANLGRHLVVILLQA